MTEFKHKGHAYTLVKPTTYMNLSGKAAAHWLSTLKIPVDIGFMVADYLAANSRRRASKSAATPS